MSLIVLKTFENAIDAHQLRAKLESEDIFCVLQGEPLASIYPVNDITMPGVKVCIHEDDAEAALLVVQELESTPYTSETEEKRTCVNCGSTESYYDFNATRGVIRKIMVILSLGIMAFPTHTKRVRRCKSCGHEINTN